MANSMFKDHVAIVTGGGRGIGQGIAIEFAREGADVAIFDIDEKNAETVAGEIKALGHRGLGFKVDVSSKKEVEGAVCRVVDELGRVDVLVNCAGIAYYHAFLDIEEEEWDHIFAVNTKGTLFCIQAAARVMIDSGNGGCIINISSAGGKGGRPLFAAYSASKAAIINLTQSAAYALADHKINVNAVCPGNIQAPMTTKANADMSALVGGEVSASHTRVSAGALDGRGTPEDVAHMVVYLAGPGGSQLTGQSVNVDGGICMH